jgi:uncharacterized membrane protein (UPF0127 family)
MKSWHRIVVGLGATVLLATIVFLVWLRVAHQPSDQASHEWTTLSLNGTAIRTEIVRLEADLQEGLSDRSSMPANQGMLFEMGYVGIHPFWMVRMHFPLDMVWIEGNKVVEIAPHMPAPGLFAVPATHTPEAMADRVLELNAGMAAKTGLKVGDTVEGLY